MRARSEKWAKNGNYIANACGNNLISPTFVNDFIEKELQEFKKEIDQKFSVASTSKYVFPWKIEPSPSLSRNIIESGSVLVNSPT